MNAREAKEANVAFGTEADEARQRVETLELQMDAMVAQFQGIVDDLRAKLASTRAELEVTQREAEYAQQWLVYLSNGILDHLGDAPRRLSGLDREMRANVAQIAPELLTDMDGEAGPAGQESADYQRDAHDAELRTEQTF